MCTRPKSLQNDILSEDPIVTLMMDLGLKKEGTTLKKFWLSEKKSLAHSTLQIAQQRAQLLTFTLVQYEATFFPSHLSNFLCISCSASAEGYCVEAEEF